MTSRHLVFSLLGVVALVAVVTALGIPVRASYGAQTTADEPQYQLSAISLFEDRDLDISDERADERYREFHEATLPVQTLVLEDGRRISPHDPLLPVIIAIPMGLGGWMAAKWTLAVIGGLVAALMAWTAIARFSVPARIALPTAVVFALSPPLAVYSTQIYPEIVAALALLAGFAALTGPFGRAGRVVFAISVIALPWLAVKFVPVAAALAVAGLVRADRGGRRSLVAVFGVAAVTYVLGHLAIYGGYTAYATGDHFVGGEFTAVGTNVDLIGRSTRLIGLITDRGFGIAAWQPAYALLPVAAGWALATRRRDLRLAVGLVAVGWGVATFVALTMHGWWFPGRQIVVVLPIAVVVVSAWLASVTRLVATTVMAVAALGVVAFAFLVVEGRAIALTWVVDFGSTTNPIYRMWSSVLPDYLAPTNATWILHTIWIVVAIGLFWVGWRSASSHDGTRQTPSPMIDEPNDERVLT